MTWIFGFSCITNNINMKQLIYIIDNTVTYTVCIINMLQCITKYYNDIWYGYKYTYSIHYHTYIYI